MTALALARSWLVVPADRGRLRTPAELVPVAVPEPTAAGDGRTTGAASSLWFVVQAWGLVVPAADPRSAGSRARIRDLAPDGSAGAGSATIAVYALLYLA